MTTPCAIAHAEHRLPVEEPRPTASLVEMAGAGFVLPGPNVLDEADLLALAQYDRRSAKKADRFAILAVAAARRALAAANLDANEQRACGIVVGTMVGGWTTTEPQLRGLHEAGLSQISPYLASTWFPAAPQGQISIHLGMTGCAKTLASNRTVLLQALHFALQQLHRGELQHILVGTSEAPKTRFIQAGHTQAQGLDAPPLGEGAGFVLLTAPGNASVRPRHAGVRRLLLSAAGHRRMHLGIAGSVPTTEWARALSSRPLFDKPATGSPAAGRSRRCLVALLPPPSIRPTVLIPLIAPLVRELDLPQSGVELHAPKAPHLDRLAAHPLAAMEACLAALRNGTHSNFLLIAADGHSLAAAHFATID
ncbi:hypothetical protein GOB17_26910 [Sinorhizobium meliloti]|uniref:beta-ketoacyl synthase N-terminal-like domain-containing protein n=1 Tax=Rhizobium meliloti TaxID=382 RepID=UPI000FD6D49B|nr:beta-ketoacyl synthase N-terminal-like domain-containing protein [Sinorhizobium meliloti]MDX2329307.1 hypothetical protein [Sinorhizobium medicae]MDW9583227.1 hypothetical protein [Sinorhizobium meliloti]MDX0185372.1 hypothetical protein [Sinorhizobium meliloti]MDX0283757.1 hypothetical protein [Sinorhizobium meliloti]RVL29948.1 hypothetical protein CN144_15055 [Sinorhizobium meliloti]